VKQNIYIPVATTSHGRNSISFDSSLASTVNYSVAYSSDLVAANNHKNAKKFMLTCKLCC